MCKKLAALLAIAWTTAGVSVAGQQTWTGVIADSLCPSSHQVMAQSIFPPLDDAACVLACVDGGGKFVFKDKGDTLLQIANQDFADLKQHAGAQVTLTGAIKGDVITISKIELAPKS